MKILVHEAFDHRLPNRQVVHCTPDAEPYTVKREVGEHGVELGRAVEIDANGKPVTKAKKPVTKPADAQTPDMAGDSTVAGIDGDADRGGELRLPGDDGPGE